MATIGSLHTQDPFSNRRAVRPLDVVVVGAGIGGLSAGVGLRTWGHNVTILEQRGDISEVGAGVQVAPNAGRILRRFGVWEDVLRNLTPLERISARRYRDDAELGRAVLERDQTQQKVDGDAAMVGVIHRGDLQRVLLKAAVARGCLVLTSQRIVCTDHRFRPRVQTAEGTWYEADLIIAADGIKSTLRSQILGVGRKEDRCIPSGDAAFRVIIPEHRIRHDPRAMSLLKQNIAMRWMGPGGHVVAYPLRNNTMYNMVLIHPAQQSGQASDRDEVIWTTPASKEKMMAIYKDWSPLLRSLISYAPDGDIFGWHLNSPPPLARWTRGNVALIGDACHPMLPYVAQGAANAIEDAGTIVAALTCTDDVSLALRVYERVRKKRAEKIQASATVTRHVLHLPDGPEQRARDQAIASAANGQGRHPDLWTDPSWQNFAWRVDVMLDTVNNWILLADEAQVRRPWHKQADRAVL